MGAFIDVEEFIRRMGDLGFKTAIEGGSRISPSVSASLLYMIGMREGAPSSSRWVCSCSWLYSSSYM